MISWSRFTGRESADLRAEYEHLFAEHLGTTDALIRVTEERDTLSRDLAASDSRVAEESAAVVVERVRREKAEAAAFDLGATTVAFGRDLHAARTRADAAETALATARAQLVEAGTIAAGIAARLRQAERERDEARGQRDAYRARLVVFERVRGVRGRFVRKEEAA